MRKRRALGLLAAGALLVGGTTSAIPGASAQQFSYADLKPVQKRLVSGAIADVIEAPTAERRGVAAADRIRQPGCDLRRGNNIKVNQNCANVVDADPAIHGRGHAQNETWIAANPHNRSQMVAGYNDYRRGDGTCGVTYSRDGGRTWTDATMPNGFVRGTAYGNKPRQYFQSSGDPGLAWDSRGNAYYSCLMFKRGAAVSPDEDQSSGMYVFRSTGTGGASWNFPARPVVEHNDTAGAGDHLEDKELLAVDSNSRSRFRDRVYVTWTRFAADGTQYILASHSEDFGETFSAPVLVSSDSGLCQENLGVPIPQGRCNINQASQPFVGPDGTLHVAWANFNTANAGGDNRFQMLVSRSTDGGASFSTPVKAGDFYELPDCDTYQGAGKNPLRACVPEKGSATNSIFRAANWPNIAVDPRDSRRVVVTYGSYISRNSNEAAGCTPSGFTPSLGSLYDGVKSGGCNNDVVLSTSTDGGATFTGSTTNVRFLPLVSDAAGQRRTDQFWASTIFSPRGTLITAYYDRQYGDDETIGSSDITLTASRGRRHQRVTTSSMPAPTQFNGQFYGDYMMVEATSDTAHPLWMDTRSPALFPCPGTGRPGIPPEVCTGPPTGPQTLQTANDQEIFTATVPID